MEPFELVDLREVAVEIVGRIPEDRPITTESQGGATTVAMPPMLWCAFMCDTPAR
jgi:hypothetical protein